MIKAEVDKILADTEPDEIIQIKIEPGQIDVFNKLLEAYDNLALVTTIDKTQGELALWVSPNTKEPVLKAIRRFPMAIEVMEF